MLYGSFTYVSRDAELETFAGGWAFVADSIANEIAEVIASLEEVASCQATEETD